MLRLKSRWTSGSMARWLTVGSDTGVELVRVRTGALAPVESGDPLDLVVSQLESEEVEVLLDPAGRHRLGDDDVADLQVPAQDRLGRRHVVGRRDLGDRQVVEQAQTARSQRAPGLG